MSQQPNIYQCRIKEFPDDFLTEKMIAIVTKTYQTAGQAGEQSNILVIASELVNDMKRLFYMLTLDEIDTACYYGVRGNYGEYYGLSIVTFNKWLKHWHENHHYHYVLKTNPNQKQLEEKKEPTPEEIEKILDSGIQRCFDEYRRSKRIIDYGNPVFDHMLSKGYFTFTDIQWQNYIMKATIEVMGELKVKAQSVDRIERQDAKRVLQSMDNQTEIESLAKCMALKDYFDKQLKPAK